MIEAPFTEDDVEHWRDAMIDNAPSLRDVRPEGQPQILGVALYAGPDHLVVRLRTAEGQDLTFTMNPVAARVLGAAIIGQGQEAGWISPTGSLAIPGTNIEP